MCVYIRYYSTLHLTIITVYNLQLTGTRLIISSVHHHDILLLLLKTRLVLIHNILTLRRDIIYDKTIPY